MSIPPIVWSDFSWEAFATLVTGALAVGGAVWIGKRQVELQALSLKEHLFDRRYKIYRTAQDYVGNIFKAASPPDQDRLDELWRAVDQSKFLFRIEVHNQLREMLHAAEQLHFAEGKIALSTNHDDRQFAENLRLQQLQYFTSLGDKFSEVFEPDLTLGPDA